MCEKLNTVNVRTKKKGIRSWHILRVSVTKNDIDLVTLIAHITRAVFDIQANAKQIL